MVNTRTDEIDDELVETITEPESITSKDAIEMISTLLLLNEIKIDHSLNSFHILHNGVFFLQGLELLTKALTYSLIKSIVIYLNELLCYQALCHLRNLSEDPMEYHEEDYNCT
ncbi:hypothetical protein BpHYR1_040382 [Brachionus plicatilis]|uniref:Uncharacterized protein n=1 Tax=Brachionus plicatilis TaxID=10195 RepID=A0A3M7QZ62_BRAPC|nr:hypothetical protein BpHYR1_040382 [Brachionus plicatilis]